MSAAQLRPTFSFQTDLNVEDVMGCIQNSLKHCPDTYHGQFTDRHAMISIDPSKRHFWSPWMHLEIRNDETQLQVFLVGSVRIPVSGRDSCFLIFPSPS